ncbi:CDP-glycerol--glycerophosphate glycerophosphotransferase [Glutamicibacter arilaitensis]|uniref:CDP-glycerol--glycerophosphate glycerophosphotransferase n=2 Tax=Glutamicibacter arilaitensis TaxID=256701 RepID=A0A2N7S4P3_9MICC|nr:CDP-glycerol--glycerophosphate glycerophosphotransferase [Glutamicibacter arilaitensis]
MIVKRLESRSNQREILARSSEFSSLPVGTNRYRAALYFGDETVNLYQARQWYEPFRELARTVPFVIIARKPASALALRKECDLPIFFAKTISDVESLVNSQQLDAVFYVNQNILNFQMMRFNEPAHIFVSHGESEKAYMWSNQLKAYDYVFSAGNAARERLQEHLTRFEATERTRLIGRPQIDVVYETPVNLKPGLPTVLYAPTWEGDRPSMSYGTVASHGVSLISSLIQDGGYNVIFRPHPRSGIADSKYLQALNEIKSMMVTAAELGRASYYYDESPHWGWQWASADLCISDISAAAYDFMATSKPLVIAMPANDSATISDSPALLRVPSLAAADCVRAPRIIRELLSNSNNSYGDLVAHYFGDTTSGASMKRFIDCSLEIIEQIKSTKK